MPAGRTLRPEQSSLGGVSLAQERRGTKSWQGLVEEERDVIDRYMDALNLTVKVDPAAVVLRPPVFMNRSSTLNASTFMGSQSRNRRR